MTKLRALGSPKDVVKRAIDEAGGVAQVGALLGLGKTRVYAFTDPDEAAEISFADICRVLVATPDPCAVPQHIATLSGGEFVDHAFGDARIAELLRKYSGEHSDVMQAALAALESKMSVKDAGLLQRECLEAARVLMHCAHQLAKRIG